MLASRLGHQRGEDLANGEGLYSRVILLERSGMESPLWQSCRVERGLLSGPQFVMVVVNAWETSHLPLASVQFGVARLE